MKARTRHVLLLAVTTALATAIALANAPAQRDETESPRPRDVEEAAMNPTKRSIPSQRALKPARPPATAQRGRWAQLDTNGDGRISGSEGQVDADFKANFDMMDANRDGFVTAVEHRARVEEGQKEPEEERDD